MFLVRYFSLREPNIFKYYHYFISLILGLSRIEYQLSTSDHHSILSKLLVKPLSIRKLIPCYSTIRFN